MLTKQNHTRVDHSETSEHGSIGGAPTSFWRGKQVITDEESEWLCISQELTELQCWIWSSETTQKVSGQKKDISRHARLQKMYSRHPFLGSYWMMYATKRREKPIWQGTCRQERGASQEEDNWCQALEWRRSEAPEEAFPGKRNNHSAWWICKSWEQSRQLEKGWD